MKSSQQFSLRVITHNCSEMHRIVAIPIIVHSSLTTTLRTDICQIGYVISEFKTVQGAKKSILSIEYVSIIEIDFLYRWAILERRPNHVYQQPVTTNPNKWLTSFWQSLHRWHRRWYEYEIFIDSCTDSMFMTERKGEVIVWWSGWSWWDLWIYGGRGFVGVQRRSCM